MTKEFDLNVPVDISGMTLQQYQKYLKLYDKWDKEDENYIKDKLDLTNKEWDFIMTRPISHYSEYNNWDFLYKYVASFKFLLKLFKI